MSLTGKRARITILAAVLLLTCLTAACSCKTMALSIMDYSFRQRVPIKVESRNSELNINDVTLDFYYGVPGSIPNAPSWYGYGKDDAELVGYALYFCDGQYCFSGYGHNGSNICSDYHSIDGYYFIKELSYEEFSSDEYSVRQSVISWFFKINHRETMTVPGEVFERENGTFVFQVTEINFSPSSNDYFVLNWGYLTVDYERTDRQTVVLSKPGNPIPH